MVAIGEAIWPIVENVPDHRKESMTATYTGHLKRGDAPDTIAGEIRDAWGWVITLTGTRNASGGYTLSGVLGETPPTLRLPNDPRDDAGGGDG